MNNSMNKPKLPEADVEALGYMEIQKKLSAKDRTLNIVLIALFFAFIFTYAILHWALPDKVKSETENRELKQFPAFSIAALNDGTFTEDFADYMADQFPERDLFIGIRSYTEKALFKGQNNGVIFAKDGYLVTRFDTVDEGQLRKNIESVSAFTKVAWDMGIDVTCAFAGRTVDVAERVLPSYYSNESSEKAWNLLDGICAENGLDYINLKTPLKERFDAGEYVYYRTDHHWTTLGALYAYNCIADSIGAPEYEASDFRIETVSDNFCGTTWSTAGDFLMKGDLLDLYRYDGDENLVTDINDGKEILDGLYKTECLETKDKYSVFIGGNSSTTTVCDNTDRETVLIVKDSFAHSVVPFIARNYNVITVDMRYYSKSLIELCESENISKVLFLYNMDTLTGDSKFQMLKLGLNK